MLVAVGTFPNTDAAHNFDMSGLAHLVKWLDRSSHFLKNKVQKADQASEVDNDQISVLQLKLEES